MKKILPNIIHKDQTGFIKQRLTQDNIRKTLHILNHVRQHKIETAEKVFDSITCL